MSVADAVSKPLNSNIWQNFEAALDIDVIATARMHEIEFHITDAREKLRALKQMIRTLRGHRPHVCRPFVFCEKKGFLCAMPDEHRLTVAPHKFKFLAKLQKLFRRRAEKLSRSCRRFALA